MGQRRRIAGRGRGGRGFIVVAASSSTPALTDSAAGLGWSGRAETPLAASVSPFWMVVTSPSPQSCAVAPLASEDGMSFTRAADIPSSSSPIFVTLDPYILVRFPALEALRVVTQAEDVEADVPMALRYACPLRTDTIACTRI